MKLRMPSGIKLIDRERTLGDYYMKNIGEYKLVLSTR